jgi:hypothetical protein
MTATTKVEGRTYADLSVWGKRFDKRAMKELAGYLSSHNLGVTQAGAFASADPSTTGTNPIMINGVYIPALTAEADADWSETTAATIVTGDLRGVTLATDYSQWIMMLARSTGLLQILAASAQVLDANIAAALKIPKWDSSTYAPIALFSINSAGVTYGTTDLSGIDTPYQLLGQMLPHPDNFAN